MNIVLVGVPGLGKGQLAQDLHVELKDNHDTVLPVVPADDYMATFDKAVGSMADYRVELSLAVRRAFAMDQYEGAIYEASLINNVAYAAQRYRRAVEDGSEDNDMIFRWWLTLQTSASMLLDTFKESHVFFIEAEPNLEFDKELQEALVAVMDQMDIEYTTVSAFDLIYEELAAKLVTDLLKGINDTRQEDARDISQPDGQD